MGRLTQVFDYMNRDPKDFSLDFVISSYTHFEITEEIKAIRKEKKWYKKEDLQQSLF